MKSPPDRHREYNLFGFANAQHGVETPGWDITSLNDAGDAIYIEVKASIGPKVDGLLITAKEWMAAIEHGSRYHIYLVTDVMKLKPRIEIIGGPAALESSGLLSARTAVWALDLSPRAALVVTGGTVAAE